MEKTVAAADDGLEADDALSEAEAARLLRRTDLRLLPMLFLVYVVAFLDRSVHAPGRDAMMP